MGKNRGRWGEDYVPQTKQQQAAAKAACRAKNVVKAGELKAIYKERRSLMKGRRMSSLPNVLGAASHPRGELC